MSYDNPATWLTRPDMLSTIPAHMHSGVKNYIVYGIRPGGFLTAVLENKLVEAFAKADNINKRNMERWANFLFSAMPAVSWGSSEAVNDWCNSGGLARKTVDNAR